MTDLDTKATGAYDAVIDVLVDLESNHIYHDEPGVRLYAHPETVLALLDGLYAHSTQGDDTHPGAAVIQGVTIERDTSLPPGVVLGLHLRSVMYDEQRAVAIAAAPGWFSG